MEIRYREAVEAPGCCCDLGLRSISNTGVHRYHIPGVGPKRAPIMFVGEAPGTDEVEAGRPLVGQAGQYFNKMLRKAGVRRGDVYLTNVVKCRNTEISVYGQITNANPTAKHIKACFPFLELEIRKVQPKVIVAMGAVALRALTGGEITGIYTWLWEDPIWSRKYEAWIVPVLHPAALLRTNPGHRETCEYMACVDRMTDTVGLLKQCKRLSATHVVFANTPQAVKKWLARVSGDFSFDVETELIENGRPGALLGLGLCWRPGLAVYFPWRLPEYEPVGEPLEVDGTTYQPKKLVWRDNIDRQALGMLRRIFANKRAVKSGHGIVFDRPVMEANGVPVADPVFDTLLAHWLLNENAPKYQGLKSIEWMYGDKGGRADWIEAYKDKDIWPKIPQHIMGEYCAEDVESTQWLASEFRPRLKAEKVEWLYDNVTLPFVRIVEEMEGHGVWIHQENLDRLETRSKRGVTRARNKIFELAGREFNLKSNPQLQSVLYEELNLPIQKHPMGPNRGKITADKYALARLAKLPGGEIAKHLLEHNRHRKILDSYVSRVRKMIGKDGRAHFHYLIHGTETGRMSGDFQQFPRDPAVRRIIAAPPGYKLITADFEQAELVIAYHLAGEKELCESLLSGTDAHALTASLIFNTPLNKVKRVQRDIGKTINFAVLYGMTAETLAGRLGVSVVAAEGYILAFFSRAPKLGEWLASQRQFAYDELFTRTPFGRKRRVYGVLRDDPTARAKAQREAVNAIIQGSVPECMAIAMLRIRKQVQRASYDSHFIGTVHDELLAEVRDDHVKPLTEIVQTAMETRYPKLGIGMRADLSVVQEWWESKAA